MSDAPAFCHWLEETAVGAAIRQSLWLFPAIETVHLVGMAALLAAIGTLDLRLLGWTMRETRVTDLARRLLPWAWAGFAVQVVTGALLFSSEAVHIYRNPAFRVKLALIALAGLHALIFHFTAGRDMARWDAAGATPAAAKVAGFLSLLLWIGVVAAGRWIGFI